MTTFNSVTDGFNYILEHPEERDAILAAWPQLAALWKVYIAKQQYDNNENGAQDLLEAYGQASNYGVYMSPETEKWLDNEISRENTAMDNQFQQQMRDTSLTSAGSQLAQLGLSTSNVIQTGGAASGVTSSAASTNKHSAAALHQQERINEYNQKMGMAKALISTAGSMASSGIYGSAIGAVKHSASALATQAAHSGLGALKAINRTPSAASLDGYGAGNNSIIRDDGSLASWAR